jgi:hypothetical protein
MCFIVHLFVSLFPPSICFCLFFTFLCLFVCFLLLYHFVCLFICLCKFWGYQGGDCWNCGIMNCCSVQSYRPTFRRSMLPLFSRVEHGGIRLRDYTVLQCKTGQNIIPSLVSSVPILVLCPPSVYQLCGQLLCPTTSRWMTQGACVTVRVNWQPSPPWICKVALSALEDKERPSARHQIHNFFTELQSADLLPTFVFCSFHFFYHSWLRHYATSRKVAGSRPDEVDFFLIYLILPAAVWSWCRLSL